MELPCFSFLVVFLITLCRATSTFSPARPPSLPLAVKSPYLSTWLAAGSDGGNGGYLPGQWPVFWTCAYSLFKLLWPFTKLQTETKLLDGRE